MARTPTTPPAPAQDNPPADAPAAQGQEDAPTQQQEDDHMDINEAEPADLMGVLQMGERRAQGIVDYIQSVGRIKKWEELRRVYGVSERTISELRARFKLDAIQPGTMEVDGRKVKISRAKKPETM